MHFAIFSDFLSGFYHSPDANPSERGALPAFAEMLRADCIFLV